MRGTVKWYEPTKGYGFIRSQDGRDVFLHHNSFRNITETRQGEELEFKIIAGEKGWSAEEIQKAM